MPPPDRSSPYPAIAQPRVVDSVTAGSRWAAPEVLATVFLGSILLGHTARVPLLAIEVKSAQLLVSDLLAATAGIWLVAAVLVAGRVRLDWPVAFVATFVGVNAVAIAASTARFDLSAGEVFFSSLYLIRWTIYAGLYAFALTVLKVTAAPRLIHTAVVVCAVFSLFGILQAIFLPNFAFIVYPDAIPYVDWDVQGNRLVSSFLDPNFAGAFIIFGLLFVHARRAETRRASYPLLILFWTALLLTLSRSSIIAALVGVALISWRTRSFHRLFFPIVAFSLVALLAADRLIQFAASYNKLTFMDPSALTRLTSWLLAWQVFLDNPIIGVGYNTFGIVRAAYGSRVFGNTAFGSDGGLLYMAAVSGLVGVALLGTVLWRLAKLGLRTYRAPTLAPTVRVLGLTLHAWIPSLVLHSAASNSLFHPLIIGPLFLLGGVCVRQFYELEQGRSP